MVNLLHKDRVSAQKDTAKTLVFAVLGSPPANSNAHLKQLFAHLEPISPNDEQTVELDKDPDQLHVEHHLRIPKQLSSAKHLHRQQSARNSPSGQKSQVLNIPGQHIKIELHQGEGESIWGHNGAERAAPGASTR